MEYNVTTTVAKEVSLCCSFVLHVSREDNIVYRRSAPGVYVLYLHGVPYRQFKCFQEPAFLTGSFFTGYNDYYYQRVTVMILLYSFLFLSR